VFNYEFRAAWVVGASSRLVDTVEGVLGRGCAIPLPGWRKSGPGEQVLSGDVVERRRSRSFWRRRKLSFGRVGGRKTAGVVGRDRESGACDELSPDGVGWGCLQATEGRQRSAEFRGEGSPSGNNARRVSVASIERCASNGSSSV